MLEFKSIARGEFVVMIAYLLVGMAAFILGRMLIQEQESRAAAQNLADEGLKKSSNGLIRLTRPFYIQYVMPMIRGRKVFDAQRVKYKRKVISAGVKDEITGEEFIAFKLLLIVFFPLALAVLKAADFIDLKLIIIFASSAVGWFYPDIWINGLIEKRQKQVIRSMPFIVDLLALSTEAGLDFVGAIGKVVEKAKPSPLVDELGQALKEMKVGASRAEALRELAARIGMSEMNSFVAILISADQMGASIGKILRQQSEQIRVERMLRAEKAGAKATQMVIVPVVIFILPSVILLVAAPFVLGAGQ